MLRRLVEEAAAKEVEMARGPQGTILREATGDIVDRETRRIAVDVMWFFNLTWHHGVALCPHSLST